MDNDPARYITATHATFEDFMECICRMADIKSLPDVGTDVVEWYRVTTDRGTVDMSE